MAYEIGEDSGFLLDMCDKPSEEYVLGCCLINIDSYIEVQTIIHPNDFFTVNHQLIFDAIAKCAKAGDVSPVLVAHLLKSEDNINRVGGPDYLYELQAPIVTNTNLVSCANIVRDYAIKRRIVSVSTSFVSRIQEGGTDIDRVIYDMTEDIQTILSSRKFDIPSTTARELCDLDLPPTQWILKNIIPTGLTVLAGGAKVGKSFFCWNLAMALAKGSTAFNSIAIEQHQNLLYLALEDPPKLIQGRLNLISYDNDMPKNLHIINNVGDLKFDSVGLTRIKEKMDEIDCKILIVDTWKFVEPDTSNTRNKTSYEIDYHKMSEVHRFCHENDISMILVTHTRKAADVFNPFNRIQGSTGMQSGADTLLMLEKDKDDEMHILHVTGREVLPNEYAMSLDDGIWTLQGDADDVRTTDARQEILNILKDAGDEGCTAKEITELSDKKSSSVKVMLGRMKADGDIVQPKKYGKYYHKLHKPDIEGNV